MSRQCNLLVGQTEGSIAENGLCLFWKRLNKSADIFFCGVCRRCGIRGVSPLQGEPVHTDIIQGLTGLVLPKKIDCSIFGGAQRVNAFFARSPEAELPKGPINAEQCFLYSVFSLLRVAQDITCNIEHSALMSFAKQLEVA